ncbi:hypothetical protein GTY65_35390 [Streptomyces sp. SID8379]|uniref:hypothetical protein n=1 Tax=unclassified Streptomyces TaxID=2593676 RepID=UPI000374416E|nr:MULTISPECIES: hypothetical protein [unclassified Streptomyces]MYW69316.1 hypothetical protein [Streptomyces sp. SID8379]
MSAAPGYAGRVQAYRVVSRAYFHLPVVVVFLVQQGFGAAATALLLALYGLTAALGDHVVAPLRRRLSLAGCLVVGEAVKIAGLLVLLAPVSAASATVSQLLSGLGFCLTAGTDAALASSLTSGERHRRGETRVQAGMFLISFAAGALGAVAYSAQARVPFALSVLGCAIAAAVVWPPGGARALRSESVTAARAPGGPKEPAVRRALPWEVRMWSAYYSVSRAVLLTAYTLLLPLVLFFGVRLSVAAFGAVLGLYTLCGLLSVRLAAVWQRRYAAVAAVSLFWLSSAAMALGLLLAAFGGAVGTVCATAFLGLAGGTVRPTTMGFLGPAMTGLPAPERQRVTRGLERRQGILQAALLSGSGLWLGLGHSPEGALAGCAALVLAGQAVAVRLILRRPAPVPAPAATPAPSRQAA